MPRPAQLAGQSRPLVAASGSVPVGLCGTLTTMSRVSRPELTAMSRSTSSAQPSSSRSSWRVTSAPVARATSYRLW